MKWVQTILFFSLLCVLAHAQTPIRVGIAPHSSPRILFESHLHVKLFLEGYFHRDVELVTAKSFYEFSKLVHEGKTYDMVITSSHLALLAHNLASYYPFMSYTQGIEIVMLARTKEVLKTSKRPLRVYAQGKISLATLLAEEWMATQGLEKEEIQYHYDISASDTLALLLTSAQADMVIMSLPNYLKLSDNLKQTMELVYQSASFPYNRTYAAKEGNGISLGEWEDALKAFSLSTQGKEHLDVVELGHFKMLSLEDLQGLAPIAEKSLQRLLGTHP